MNKYDLEYIDKLRIHELRDFARKLGVGSPTTLKKEELIVKITSIMKDSGVKSKKDNQIDFFALLVSDNSNIIANLLSIKKENIKQISANTPNKEASDKSNTMIMKKSSRALNDDVYPSFDNVEFSFSIKQDVVECDDESVYYVKGYLDIHPSGYGILRQFGFVPSDDDSYLTSSLVNKHNLKKGHFVLGKAKYIIEGKPKVLYEITDIDNVDACGRDYDSLSYNGIGKEYCLDKYNLTMRKGERHYIGSMSIADAVGLATDFVEENATRVKFVNIKSRPEDNYKSVDKLEIINVPFNLPEVNIVNTVELVFERIKREIEYGKQNVFILYNFCELIRVFNVASEGCIDFEKINANAVNKIYKLLYLSKYIDESLNCSLICIDKNGIPRDLKSLMELELLPLFNEVHENINKI